MNVHPDQNWTAVNSGSADPSPILLIPYMWIGDFVRCHSVVKVLKARWPERPVDVLTTPLTAPLIDYMPGIRKGIIWDLPRRSLAFASNLGLGRRLRREHYGTALVMSRKWKAAVAPFLAGIPERIGFVGEARFLLLTDARWGERKLERMVDQCAALALPKGAALPAEWPLPELRIPQAEIETWRARRCLAEDGRPVIALAPGAVGPSKRWPSSAYAELARQLSMQGFSVWILGGAGEAEMAAAICEAGPHVRNLTGHDLRDAILALATADIAISNDSGLLHVAAASGTPAVGIFGPTSARRWAPLNPLAATIETKTSVICRPCHKPFCRFGHHRCMRDISVTQVMETVARTFADEHRAVPT